MPDLTPTSDLVRKTRCAGLLYLIIIVTGLGAELGLRGPLIDLQDAGTTAAAILDAPGRFRLAIAADFLMAVLRCWARHIALSDLPGSVAGACPVRDGVQVDPDRADRREPHDPASGLASDLGCQRGCRCQRPRSDPFRSARARL